jgi:hypothetical protein
MAEVPLTPPGWSYNPSAWSQRLPIAGLSVLGFATATYLALYQWGVLADVWEPFFGDGSRRILHSWVSKLFPIPDAALGAAAYLLDAVTAVIGGRARWKTMPWMVMLFGIAVGPMGLVGIVLIVIQPLLFDAWCTLCILSAGISLAMIYPSLDEVVASWQYVRGETRRGQAFWQVMLKGADR